MIYLKFKSKIFNDMLYNEFINLMNYLTKECLQV